MINSTLGTGSKSYAFVLPLIGGILFGGIGFFMGRTHLQLIFRGARAQGTVVDFRPKTFTSVRDGRVIRSTTGYMPIVEYRAFRDNPVRFEDWLGSSTPGKRNHLNEVVPVLYDPRIPSLAMIDRPIWNWVPWGPVIIVGVLLIISGIRRASRSF